MLDVKLLVIDKAKKVFSTDSTETCKKTKENEEIEVRAK